MSLTRKQTKAICGCAGKFGWFDYKERLEIEYPYKMIRCFNDTVPQCPVCDYFHWYLTPNQEPGRELETLREMNRC